MNVPTFCNPSCRGVVPGGRVFGCRSKSVVGKFVFGALLITLCAGGSGREASSEDWSPIVIPTGEYRRQIQATPIPERPDRPLHVYGNTIRYLDQLDSRPGLGRPARQILLGTDRLPRRRAVGGWFFRVRR